MSIARKYVQIGLLAFAVAASLPTALHAADSAQKIAVVRLQDALNQTEAGKTAKASLEKEGQDKQKQLSLLEDELKKMQEDLQKQKMVLSDDVMKEKAKVFQQKYTELQKKAASFEQEMKRKEAESINAILEGLQQVVSDIAKERGYLYVVENSHQTLAYISASVDDLTAEAIARYNKAPPAAKKK